MRSVTLSGLLAALLCACGGGARAPRSDSTATTPTDLPPVDPPAEPAPSGQPASGPPALPPAQWREPFAGCERNEDLPASTPLANGSCEDLLPGTSEPHLTSFSVCSAWECDEPLGSGSGTLAALLVPWNGGGRSTELVTWDSNGGEARIAADMYALGALHPLPSGFAFVEGYELGDLTIVPDDAGPVRSLTLPWGPFATGPWNSTVDAAGRFVMAAVVSTSSSGPFDLQVSRIDPASGQVDGPVSVLYMDQGQIIGLASPSNTSEVDVAVDLAGRILVLWNGEWSCGTGTIGGRWLGPDLAPLGPPFVAGGATLGWPYGDLVPLLDGSIVLRKYVVSALTPWLVGSYTRRFEGGISAGGAVPSWLAEPEFGDVVALPGGRGYARVPFSKVEVSPGTCVAGLEVLAPDGSSCGTIRLGPAEPCSKWSPALLGTVTADGTVVRRLAVCPSPEEATCCRYAWWPNLLAP